MKRRTATAPVEEAELLALRAGDERAFEELVDRYHGMLLAVARTYVKSGAVAEEVVQDAWLGVLNGLDRFEGRSSLKHWILRMSESADHISCQEVVELVTDYLEEALPAEEMALVEQHLNFCDGCVWYVEQMRTTATLVGRIGPALLGFVAARIAEEIAGSDAYTAERARQTQWLVERLGLRA